MDWSEFLHAMRVDGSVSVRDMSDQQVHAVFVYLVSACKGPELLKPKTAPPPSL